MIEIKDIQRKKGNKILCVYIKEGGESQGWIELTKEIRESEIYKKKVKQIQERKRNREEDESPARKHIRKISGSMIEIEDMKRLFTYDDSWVDKVRQKGKENIRKSTQEYKKWLQENLQLDQTGKISSEEIKRLQEENEKLQENLDKLHKQSEKLKRETQRERNALNEERQRTDRERDDLNDENRNLAEEQTRFTEDLESLQRENKIQQETAEKERVIAEQAAEEKRIRKCNLQHEKLLHALIQAKHEKMLSLDDNLDLIIDTPEQDDQVSKQFKIHWKQDQSICVVGDKDIPIDNEKLPEFVSKILHG